MMHLIRSPVPHSSKKAYLHLRLAIILLIALCSFVALAFNLEERLKKYKIYPDIVSAVPKLKVEVSYGNKIVDFGNKFSVHEVQLPPVVKWPYTNNSLYTLIMTDINSPYDKEPHIKEVCYWWVANIKGNDIKGGETVESFLPPRPSFRRGGQYYVFIVFKQPKKVKYLEDPKLEENETRADMYSTPSIAKKYNLGPPEAINFFQIFHPGAYYD